jgi:Flp pilus assembly protein TadB
MEDLEQKLRQLEREATNQSQNIPLVASVNQLTGWKKLVVVVIIGLVLFTIVKMLVNLLVAVVTIGIFGLIVFFLYKLFFRTKTE